VSHADAIRDADPKLLRELADAVDEDRGHGKSLLTLTMRQAADDLEALLALSSLQAQEIDAFDEANQQLRDALLGVQLTEINGRLCARPEPPDPWFDDPEKPRESKCCPACRKLWEQIDAALAAVRVEER
jgi:hypothetical protein